MVEQLEGCRSLIISTSNLALLGTRFSYDDYEQFYEKTFLPMTISQEKLLIRPADIDHKDAEDADEEDDNAEDESNDESPLSKRQEKKINDLDFGDDFW